MTDNKIIVIVFVSSSIDSKDKEEALAALEADFILTKPFDLRSLKNVEESLFGIHRSDFWKDIA